ncbi:NAD-dependent epimerase/dehydratase family protein [soil metagenome]
MHHHSIVTGCAGFIGSNLVDRLLAQGHRVTGVDNFSTGQRRFLVDAMTHPAFTLIEGDLYDPGVAIAAFPGGDTVFHFAANADVRFGTDHPRRDLEQNTIVTYNVLEGMRANAIRRIAFSSTGSVYGEATVIPTPEDAPFPIQTSLYGASKLACEGLIAAYCEGFAFQGWIFRFVSILGPRYTHGHVFDFFKQLLAHPDCLTVLGDGQQRKSYLDVEDCLDGIQLALANSSSPVNVFNLGQSDYCQVNDSISWITNALGVSPERQYTGGARGWIGDNPFIFLDTARIRGLGFAPRHSIRDGIVRTVKFLRANPWVLESRA